MFTLIAAVGINNELGKDNAIIWHLPDDFKRFKELTSHHYIIMGRKTFESFPKPLPNRTHIVITKQQNYAPEGCIVVHSMESAIAMTQQEQEVFIIGGGEIYILGIAFATKIELTRVTGTFDADTFFPRIDANEWELITEIPHAKDEKHLYNFVYQTYVRK